jgi:hypothetical protein
MLGPFDMAPQDPVHYKASFLPICATTACPLRNHYLGEGMGVQYRMCLLGVLDRQECQIYCQPLICLTACIDVASISHISLHKKGGIKEQKDDEQNLRGWQRQCPPGGFLGQIKGLLPFPL